MDNAIIEWFRAMQSKLEVCRPALFAAHENLIGISALPDGTIEVQVSGDVAKATEIMIDELQEHFPEETISIIPAKGTAAFQSLRRRVNIAYPEINKINGLETLQVLPDGQSAFLRVGVKTGSAIRMLDDLFPGVRLKVVNLLPTRKDHHPVP